MEGLPASQLAVAREVLAPPVCQQLADCLRGDNFDRLPDPVLIKHRPIVYAARTVTHPAIELVRLPAGTRLFGGWHFLLEYDGQAVAEQIPPQNVLSGLDKLEELSEERASRIDVHDPCVMVARFGLMVWGHWVGELLPRILLTERLYPGRFKFVLPPHVFNGSAPRNVWNSIWDTIRLLGVDRERILAARPDRHYVFSQLHMVTPSITEHAFHPELIDKMRAAYLSSRPAVANRRIAILRTESKARNISNIEEVIPILRQRNFEFVEIGVIPFQEQLHLFSTASYVVGVLASGLTGLLFSPDRVRMLSVAPQGFVNQFFYPLVQSRLGSHYDIRGRITERDPRSDVFSNFHVDVADLELGLDRLEVGA